jgi:hypothetical protein
VGAAPRLKRRLTANWWAPPAGDFLAMVKDYRGFMAQKGSEAYAYEMRQ